MSAVGKSSVIRELLCLGHRAVDLDTPDWSHLVPDEPDPAAPGVEPPMDWRWQLDKVQRLLSSAGRDPLFVAGTSTHQGRCYPFLDHVVLLTVPGATAVHRLATRTTNDYGKDPAELRRELQLRGTVEPLLRASACHEIDTSVHPVPEVAALITEHAARARPCRSR
jgi:hypothetical protein